LSTNFGFLQPEWPQIYESAVKAESFVFPDPGTACIHARRTLELVMQWLFKSDATLKPPYQQNLSALVHEPTFVQVAGYPSRPRPESSSSTATAPPTPAAAP
jgi:type I restriction enzyme R subunit